MIVRKSLYKLSATPDVIRLDLSAHGAERAPKEIQVVLQTRLATAEPVWLSATDGADREQPEQLTFTQVADDRGVPIKGTGKAVKFRCEGLGKPQAVKGSGQPDRAALSFVLSHDGPLAAGVYQRQLYLVGDSVIATPVTVHVVANLVTVRSDRAAVPLDEVYLLGLAGADVRQTLQLQTGLGAKVKAVRAVGDWPRLKNISAGGWDELTLTGSANPDAPDQLTVGLKVPLCVQEGRYRGTVQLQVNAAEAGQAERPLLVSLPVYLEVRHTGVRFQRGGLDFKEPLRLASEPGDACAPFVTADFQLVTDAQKAPVRWRVERVAPAAGFGKALPADDGRVDVLFKDRSVLGKAASEPIRHDHPASLTVKVSRHGLEPGWYRTVLRFHSGEDHAKAAEGAPIDLPLEILMPGRVLVNAMLKGPTPLGSECELQCTLLCYGCDPAPGAVTLTSAAEAPLAKPLAVGEPLRSEADKHVPGLVRHHYRVAVKPPRPGKNHYELSWPSLCPGRPATTLTVAVETLSRLDVSPTTPFVDEEVTLRAHVDPALAPESGRPLILRACRAVTMGCHHSTSNCSTTAMWTMPTCRPATACTPAGTASSKRARMTCTSPRPVAARRSSRCRSVSASSSTAPRSSARSSTAAVSCNSGFT